MAQQRANPPGVQVFEDISKDFGNAVKIWPDTCEGRRDAAKWNADRVHRTAIKKAEGRWTFCMSDSHNAVSAGVCALVYAASVSAATLAYIAAIEAADDVYKACAGSIQAFTSTSRQERQEQLGVQLNPSAISAITVTKIELAIKREQEKLLGRGPHGGPQSTFGHRALALAIPIGLGVEVLCYGLFCAGAGAICLANNEPMSCPDWDEFNDDVALWAAYLALLLVCQVALNLAAAWHAALLMVALTRDDVEAADKQFQLAKEIYDNCIKLAYDEYIEKGGTPRPERQY